jgi:hypothetical protein
MVNISLFGSGFTKSIWPTWTMPVATPQSNRSSRPQEYADEKGPPSHAIRDRQVVNLRQMNF